MVVILKCMYIIIVLYFDVCMISFAGVTFSVSLWLQWGSMESKMEVTCAKSHVLRVCQTWELLDPLTSEFSKKLSYWQNK